ncbi:MAG: DNA adenine methylase [Flavobacteriales bacterium]
MSKQVTTNTLVKGKPFLRWAGGKNWLVKDIHNHLPKEGFKKYVEPFLGGGSIFFHLSPEESVLSDLNGELIQAYTVLKEDVNAVINELARYKNTEEFYYSLRAKKPRKEVNKAARFIYLNQTSFNGIYRVNLKGEYNVPYGHRKKNFLQPDNLIQASERLQKTQLKERDFRDSLEDINKGDLVFLDPPYTVSHNNSGFIKYNKKLFDIDEQRELSRFLDGIHEIGAHYILTNAAHDVIKEIFHKPGINHVKNVSRASLVGGLKAKRQQYAEFIITNVETHG